MSPLFIIWSDVRILYLYQLLGLAIAGLLLYKMVHERRPTLAVWFVLTFFLNPVLHQIALIELCRVTLAVPFIALCLYGLHTKQRGLLLAGVLLTLLTKEDMGLVVFGIGLFLLIFERDSKWGGALAVVGLAWTASMLFLVIPAIDKGAYPQTG